MVYYWVFVYRRVHVSASIYLMLSDYLSTMCYLSIHWAMSASLGRATATTNLAGSTVTPPGNAKRTENSGKSSAGHTRLLVVCMD